MIPVPIIFVKADCYACATLEAWMDDRKIQYEIRDADSIGLDVHANEIMAELALNDMKLPVLWYSGKPMTAEAFKREVLVNA